MKRLFAAYWPSMIVVAVILYATLFPDPMPVDDMSMIPGFDKLIHALMFGGLAGAIAFDYSRCHDIARPSRLVMARIAVCVLFAGGGIELLQQAMGLGRGAEWADFAADSLGVIVAFFSAPPAIQRVLFSKLHKK